MAYPIPKSTMHHGPRLTKGSAVELPWPSVSAQKSEGGRLAALTNNDGADSEQTILGPGFKNPSRLPCRQDTV
jgi:hypothetical protein